MLHSFNLLLIYSSENIRRVLTSDGQGKESGGVFPGDGRITADKRNPAQEVIHEVESRDGRQIPSQLGDEQ